MPCKAATSWLENKQVEDIEKVISKVSMDSGIPVLKRCSNKKNPEIKMINEDSASIDESNGVRKKKGIRLSKSGRSKLKNIATPSSLSSTSSSAASSYHVRRAHVKFVGKRSKISSKDGTFEDLALPIGMSFAAIISQVLDEINRSRKQIPVEQLSLICTSALKESVANLYGNRLDSFLLNFEKSFGSTLRTLRKIKEASVPRHQFRSSQMFNKAKDATEFYEQSIADQVEMQSSSQPNNKSFETLKGISPLTMETNQIVPHRAFSQELASSSHNLSGRGFSQSVISTFEQSVMEQRRSNVLKIFEIVLDIRKLKLKESQLAVSTYANILEKIKISMGTVKASFKEEKLRNQMLDSKHADFLRRCSDLLVSGLIIMSICLGCGAYTFSYQRIIEATLSCSEVPTSTSKESTSWWSKSSWMPKPMASFNAGFHTLRCQVNAFSRLFFGLAIILAIAYSVFQRSSVSSPTTMPLTFIIILGFMCGLAGKFCIDTLGGSGYYWLLLWEALCMVHFLANMFPSIIYMMLYGSVSATSQMNAKGRIVPYWTRRLAFNLFVAFVLPAMCGLLPFASVADWMVQFSAKFNYLYYIQDSG